MICAHLFVVSPMNIFLAKDVARVPRAAQKGVPNSNSPESLSCPPESTSVSRLDLHPPLRQAFGIGEKPESQDPSYTDQGE